MLDHFRATMHFRGPDVADGLAAGREVILVNNAGLGANTGETPTYIDTMTKDMVAFLDAMGLTQVDDLGFSMGGMVAQLLAAGEPDRVRRVVMASTWGDSSRPLSGRDRRVFDSKILENLKLNDLGSSNHFVPDTGANVMSKHAITLALENVDIEGLASSLSADAVFDSPILATTGDEVRGREVLVQIIGTAIRGFGAPKNVTEYHAEDGRYIVAFDGEIGGHPINCTMTMTEDAAGKVVRVAPHLRPYPVVTLFREHMKAHLCPNPVPESIWALPGVV